MKILTLTAHCQNLPGDSIFCPILRGLNAAQSDCASIIPCGNANGSLIEQLSSISAAKAHQVAILCTDPFINKEIFFTELYGLGVRSLCNWPSSIFLEHNFQKAMGAINVNPMAEFECLSLAQKAGMEARAFIISLNQGKQAIEQGISNLIVHPGLNLNFSKATQNTRYDSLHFMIQTLLGIDAKLNIYIYQHSLAEMNSHQNRYQKVASEISGYVVYGDDNE